MTDVCSPDEESPEDDGYRVGKGRPPRHTQFGQPGVRGNRYGRPKGSSPKEVFRKVSNEKVPVRVGPKTKKVTSTEAIMMRVRHMALEGNLAAVREYRTWLQLFGMTDRYFEDRELPPPLPTVFISIDPDHFDEEGKRIGPEPDWSALAAPKIREKEAEIRKEYEKRKREDR